MSCNVIIRKFISFHSLQSISLKEFSGFNRNPESFQKYKSPNEHGNQIEEQNRFNQTENQPLQQWIFDIIDICRLIERPFLPNCCQQN